MTDSFPALMFYGDDFTGATDTLGTAARAGLRALLFVGIPNAVQLKAAKNQDCIGIAGAARAMSPDEIRVELAPVGRLFNQLGSRVLHYKVCSTFDSSPQTGSIGVAIQELRSMLPPGTRSAIIGGQPDLGRYCLFGNLFARGGADGPVARIDRHPTMSRHPVTPMHEADLRMHLAEQGLNDAGLVSWLIQEEGASRLSDAFHEDRESNVTLFDVRTNSDLRRIGEVLWQASETSPLLVTGASSVVQALAPQIRDCARTLSSLRPASGPVFVLAGSMSPITARQIESAQLFEKVWIDPVQLVLDEGYLRQQAKTLAEQLRAGRNVLACTVCVGSSEIVDTAPSGREIAIAGGRLLRAVVNAAPAVDRIGVAGGDTSSHAVQSLNAWGLSYCATVSSGVSMCRLHSLDDRIDGLEVALKGGQMGAVDLFDVLVHGSSG